MYVPITTPLTSTWWKSLATIIPSLSTDSKVPFTSIAGIWTGSTTTGYKIGRLEVAIGGIVKVYITEPITTTGAFLVSATVCLA
ncbi:MAG: hypothetical protein ACRC42_03125 [Mycoplasma sp.]